LGLEHGGFDAVAEFWREKFFATCAANTGGNIVNSDFGAIWQTGNVVLHYIIEEPLEA
jgi:hypothetical protein